MVTLIKQGFTPPSQILEDQINDKIDIDEYNTEIGERLGILKENETKNAERINKITSDIKLLQKHRKRTGLMPEGSKTIGTGI